MPRALVIEADVAIHHQITDALKDQGIAVEFMSKPAKARDKILASMPDLVLLDIHLPNFDAFRVARIIKQSAPNLPIILLTSRSTSPTVRGEAQELGASVFPTRPFRADQFLRRVRTLIRDRRTKASHEVSTAVLESLTSHLLPDLNDPMTGRLDAKRIANYLSVPLSSLADAIGKNDAAVHKSPAAPSLQEALVPIARSLAILFSLLQKRESVLAWLNSPHPDLGSRTPLSLILTRKANTVAQMLEGVLAGQPS